MHHSLRLVLASQLIMKLVKTLNLLSIDVVLGAMVCNALFWKFPDGKSPISWLHVGVLGLSIFVIYTLDRLLDNLKASQIPTGRHLFHQRYALFLWILLGIIALFIVGLLFFLPTKTLWVGSTIGLIVLLYLWVVSKITTTSTLQYGKEFVTTWVYTAGVWGTTLPYRSFSYEGIVILVLVFQNLLLFSWCEQKIYPNVHSLASYFGENKTKNIIIFIFIVIFCGNVFSLVHSVYHFKQQVALLFIVMSFILTIIPFNTSFFLKNDRYRWIGDGIFLLPTLLLIV